MQHHVGELLRSGLGNNLTTTGDIRTAGSCVDSAPACVNNTVNNNNGVSLISAFYSQTTGSIGKGIICSPMLTNIATHACRTVVVLIPYPVIGIVYDNSSACCQSAGNTFAHIQLRAGKQNDILVNGNITGGCFHREMAGNRQIVFLGINRNIANQKAQVHGYGNIADRNITANGKFRSACTFQVILGNGTAGQDKHGAASRRTDNRHAALLTVEHSNINGNMAKFLGTCFQRQRHFNILNEVLRHGENVIHRLIVTL